MKRSLFNRPAWSKPTVATDNTNLFHRSDETYHKIAAEEERRRDERRIEKERIKTLSIEGTDHISGKQRHLSIENNNDSENSHGSIRSKSRSTIEVEAPSNQCGEGQRYVDAVLGNESSPESSVKQVDTTITENPSRICMPTTEAVEKETSRRIQSNIVDLDDSFDDGSIYKPPVRRKSSSPRVITTKAAAPLRDDFLPSDDEFEELARAARERARRKRLQEDIALPPPLLSPAANDGISAFLSPSLQGSISPEKPPANDPVLQILITSKLPNTSPLIVNRKASQRLKDVRVTWCNRQAFSAETTSSVFLTWRGKRLFDVTTCKSLGIAADEDGNLHFRGRENAYGEEERQIHMEAMTDELFAEYKIEKQRKEQATEDSGTEGFEAEKAVQTTKASSEPQVRIIVKAKGYSDFKLIVRPVRILLQVEPGVWAD